MAQARRKPEEQRRPEERERPRLREVRPGEERMMRPERAELPTSGLAIAGLVLSLVSLVLPIVIALIGGIVGVVLGVLGLNQVRRGERSGGGIAWAAIIIGALVAIAALFFLAPLLTGGGATPGTGSSIFQNFMSL